MDPEAVVSKIYFALQRPTYSAEFRYTVGVACNFSLADATNLWLEET
jgi:hypothetical protein